MTWSSALADLWQAFDLVILVWAAVCAWADYPHPRTTPRRRTMTARQKSLRYSREGRDRR